jgi:hypothetical protein
MPLSLNKLILGLSESFGKQRAEHIIHSIIRQTGLPLKDIYTKEEAFRICDQMDASEERFIRIIGNSVRVQVMLMHE